MTPDLVIFDCDGVLVDSEPPSNQIMADNLTRHGLPMTLEESMATFVGSSMVGVAQKARAMGAELPADDVWIAQMYEEMYARLRQGVDAIPGVVAVLDALDAAAVPYCIVSNGSDEKMDITLGSTGMAARFEGVRFSSHTHGVSKPDPELFFIAARHMGVAAERAVVIEDSPTGGLGAQRAGMACFGYAPEGSEALRAVGAHVFADMVELPALLGLPK